MGHLTCATHKRRAVVIGGKVLHRSGHQIIGGNKLTGERPVSVPLERECGPIVVVNGKQLDTSTKRQPNDSDDAAGRNLLQQIFGV